MSTTRAAIAGSTSATVEAGARIARLGGNAVDIAVAAALTATAAEVLMCSLGGSGFIMLHLPGGAPELIEGADAMPGLSRPGRALAPPVDSPAWRQVHIPHGDGIDVMAGHASVAVPGVLAALELAWQRHGSLPWREVMAPVVELTRTGWPLGEASAMGIGVLGRPIMDHQPASRACFFPDGRTMQAGEVLRIPGLHDSMEAIARHGSEAFYRGDLAAAFAREMADNGGFVTREDLSGYRAQVRKPLRLLSRGFEMALNPPPSVGGAAVGTLIGLLEIGWNDQHDPATQVLHNARAQQYILGLRGREFHQRDFDDARARAILEEETLRRYHGALKSPNTTQLSVATGDGSMVAITMSQGYGSGVNIPSTGIVCNNSLGEPELNPHGYFAAAPGERVVSNMAPTVAWHPDGRCIAFGSPGASRITTAIAQTWMRFAFEGSSFQHAVEQPRLHIEEWDDGFRAQCEPGLDIGLLASEFIVRPFAERHLYFGGTQVAGRARSGTLHAIADSRRGGKTVIVE